MVRVKSAHAASIPFKDTTNVQNRKIRNDSQKRTTKGCGVQVSKAAESDVKLKSPCFVKLTTAEVANHNKKLNKEIKESDFKFNVRCFVKLTPLDVKSFENVKMGYAESEKQINRVANKKRATKKDFTKCEEKKKKITKKEKTEFTIKENKTKRTKALYVKVTPLVLTNQQLNKESSSVENKKTVVNTNQVAVVEKPQKRRVNKIEDKATTEKKRLPARKEDKRATVKQINKNYPYKDGRRRKEDNKALNSMEDSKNEKCQQERKLRSRKPINYQDTTEDSFNVDEPNSHLPIYRKKLDGDECPKKKNVDVYEFFLDEKEKKTKRKRASDQSFKVKLPKRQKKVTWSKKAKEILDRLGLDMTSKTLKEDVEKLVEAKRKTDLTPEQTSKKSINVISHIVIPPSVNSTRRESLDSIDSLGITSTPIASSTMVADNKVTPWRLQLPVKYNPHFLKVKPNALPSVDQEPILDATFTKNVAKTAPKPTQQKSPQIQSSILTFVESSKNFSAQNSLFNINEYSPFKEQTNSPAITMENVEKQREKSKRNLLQDFENCGGVEPVNHATENRTPLRSVENKISTNKNQIQPLVSNKENLPSILTENNSNKSHFKKTYIKKLKNKENTPLNTQTSSDDLNNYFGFTSIDEEPKIKKPSKTDKPTRIPVVVLINILKKTNDNRVDFIDEYSHYSKNNVSESSSENESVVDDDEASEVPLFVDLKPKMPNRSYQKRTKKPRRRQSDTVVDDESNYNFKHKDKKAKQEWTDEAEKWAEAFNSVCQDIENYQLEIE